MVHFYQLGRGMRMLTKQLVQNITFPGQDYQYNQVKNLIGKLKRVCNIFRPLTQFESLVKSGGRGGADNFSNIYSILLSLSKVKDGVKRRWEMVINNINFHPMWLYKKAIIKYYISST